MLCYITVLLCILISHPNAIQSYQLSLEKNKTWMNYAVFGLHSCISKVSMVTRSLNEYRNQGVRCVLNKLVHHGNCRYFTKMEMKMTSSQSSAFCSYLMERFEESKSTLNNTEGNNTIAEFTQWKPAGQECINVMYNGYQSIKYYLNTKSSRTKNMLNKLRYRFKMNSLFGLRVTFKVFLLSDMCLVYHPNENHRMGWNIPHCFYHKGTEYVLFHQNEPKPTDKLYFCMKRPEWSVYTKNIVTIEYTICELCINYESSLVFNYQIINRNTILTIRDDYNRIFSGHSKGSVLDLMSNDLFRVAFIFFVRVEKYQHIQISKYSNSAVKMCLLDDINHDKISREIPDSIGPVHIEYFHCSVLVLMKDGPWLDQSKVTLSTVAVYYYIKPKTKLILNQKEQSNVSFTSDSCNNGNSCLKVYKIQNVKNKNIKISIKQMVYTGWKVPSCLFGGVSFFEMDEGSLRETLTLCDNYTSFENRFSENIHKNYTSQYFSNNSFYHLAPYRSATKYLVVSFYVNRLSSLNVTFDVSLTTCQGIFVNPCMRTKYNDRRTLPQACGDDIIKYDYTKYGHSCVSVQFDLRFLHNLEQGSELNFYLVFGCMERILMYMKLSFLCEADVTYLQMFQVSSYLPVPFSEMYQLDSFMFHSSLTTKLPVELSGQRFKCRETRTKLSKYRNNKNHEWNKGTDFYSMNHNISKYNSSIHWLKTKIKLTKRRLSDLHLMDMFFKRSKPFSESTSIITLTNLKCNNFNPIDIYTAHILLAPATPLTPKVICIKDPAKSIMPAYMILELSVIGQFKLTSCSLGHVNISTWLCTRDGRMFTQTCTQKPEVVMLTWSENLLTDLAHSSNKGHLVELPGKVLDAKFISSPSDCCLQAPCFLKYRWEYRQELIETGFQILYNPFQVLSGNEDKENDPVARTWYEAKKMCEDRGENLPSFVSIIEINNILEFIKMISHRTQVQSFFIGIQKRTNSSSFSWSDGRPVGMQMWGSPFSLPQLTGNSFVTSYGSGNKTRVKMFTEIGSFKPLNMASTSSTCGVMSVSNLMNPQWRLVPCDAKLNVDVLCSKDQTSCRDQDSNTCDNRNTFQDIVNLCPENHILFLDECYTLTKQRTKHSVYNSEFRKEFIPSKESLMMRFMIILQYISKVNKARIAFAFPTNDFSSSFKLFKDISAEIQRNDANFSLYRKTEDWKIHGYCNTFRYFKRTRPSGLQMFKCKTKLTMEKIKDSMSKYISASDDTYNVITCIEYGKIRNYTLSTLVYGLKHSLFYVGQPDNNIQYYEYDALRELFTKVERKTLGNFHSIFFVNKMHARGKLNKLLGNSPQTYKCSSGEYISLKKLHNNIEECLSGNDEIGLTCFMNGQKRNDSYCKTSCLRPNCMCPPLYYQKSKGGCFLYSKHPRKRHLYTDNVAIERLPEVNNLSSILIKHDCCEHELQKINNSYFINHCPRDDEIQCTYGCARCFSVYKLCVYELDHHGNLMHCPSGAHIKNCGLMECNNMLKCYQYYCIPYRHICDGTWQCPDGDDELLCDQYSCTGLFRCVEAQLTTCLHPSSICDGVNDCLSGEDEYLCDLPKKCPEDCHCLMYAFACINSTAQSLFILFNTNTVFLKLSKVSEDIENHMKPFNIAHRSVAFYWIHSNLKDICALLNISSFSLQILDFSFNNVTTIADNCFQGNQRLKTLVLHNNQLEHIEPLAFASLTEIIKLDLSCNKMKKLFLLPLRGIDLHILNISFNRFVQFQSLLNAHETIDNILTEDYRICCLMASADTVCLTKPEWPKSCKVLLDSPAAKIITVSQFILIIILNCAAIFIGFGKCLKIKITFYNSKGNDKIKFRSKYPTFLINVLFINFNDILFGLYLVFEFVADRYYDSLYAAYEVQWLSSLHCKIIGLLSAFAMLNSLFLLNLTAISRLLIVKYPLKLYLEGRTATTKYLATGLIFNSLLCIITLFFYQIVEQNNSMPSATCLFLGETINSKTVQIATLIMASLQLASFITISVLYIVIVTELKEGLMMGLNNQNVGQVLVQSLLVTVTNALCWLPSSAIYIVSVVLETYPTNLLVWNAILINPLNSVINPIIFCGFPVIKGRFKRVWHGIAKQLCFEEDVNTRRMVTKRD